MIRRATFSKGFRWYANDNFVFSRGDSIVFKDDFNVIVGSQRVGKSTLIELIRSRVETFNGWAVNRVGTQHDRAKKCLDIEIVLPPAKTKQRIRGLCFETEVTHTSTPTHKIPYNGTRNPNKNWQAFETMMKENDNNSGALIILNEPDVSLSTPECLELVNYLANEVWNNHCQLIMTVNNPVVISCFKNVYDLDTRSWLTSDDYLNQFLEGRSGQIFNSIQELQRL